MNPMALVPGGEARRGRCLGADLTAYADRAMDPSSLRQWDRHLVACTSCRAAVDDERRVLASLRSSSCASAVPGELRGMLLALASALDLEPESAHSGPNPVLPPVPVAPVPVVDRGMPAFHRSARRATMFAGIAAGATAAAAWSLALTGGAVATAVPSTPTPGAVQRTRPAIQGYVAASFVVSTVGLTRTTAPRPGFDGPTPPPGVSSAPAHSAESTP
jgi:hypothetical protein